jgi:hypothetical protein
MIIGTATRAFKQTFYQVFENLFASALVRLCEGLSSTGASTTPKVFGAATEAFKRRQM